MDRTDQTNSFKDPQAVLRLQSVTLQTQRRLRAGDALRAMSRWLPWGVLFLTPWAILYRFRFISGWVFGAVLLLCSVALVGVVVRASLKGPGLLAAALLLDRTHQLSGRLATVLEFTGFLKARVGSNSPSERAYYGLVVDQVESWGEVSAKRAAPVEVPGGFLWGFLMLAAFAFLVLVPARSAPPPVASNQPAQEKATSNWVAEDDAQLLQRSARELTEAADSEQGQKAAERFNEIVLQVVSGQVTQAEALRLVAELQAELDGSFAEAEQLRAGLEKRGESLEKRAITREIGKALREQRYQDAEEAFKRLAERLTQGTDALSESEMNELRESLEETRKENQEAAQKSEQEEATQNDKQRKSLEKKRDELSEKKKQGKASAQDVKDLAKTERELKRLDRQKAAPQASQELSELDKELAKAAQELAREQKKSGEFLDSAGQKVGQASKRQISDKEKREMLKQIEEMKERLRRQNQDGKQAERLRKFQERARGQDGSEGGDPGQGKPGQGKSGQSGEMRLGPGGTPIPVPGEGPGQGEGSGKEGEGEGEEEGGTGREPGHGHDPQLAGEESRLADAKAQDAAAVAQDTGAGESASETIRTAAEEGFSSGSYEKLFREYRSVAEEVMDKETVPPGRKAHVRRYFELIRPRGDSSADAPVKEQK